MRIDLKTVLQESISASFRDLVTRPTGRAVRGSIERQLDSISSGRPAIIDFGEVGCLDYSCADEIVAKLIMEHGESRYFVLRGLDEGHLDALESVLERHGLVVAAVDRSGQAHLIGTVGEATRRVFSTLVDRGSAAEDEIAEDMSTSLDAVRAALEELYSRRLAFRIETRYQSLTAI